MACLSHRNDHLGRAREGDGPVPFVEPGVVPHYAPDRAVAIEHADLHLSFEPEARTFRGEVRFRLRRLASFRGRFGFDLDEVEVESVTDGAGEPLSWRHDSDQLRIDAAQVPDTVVVRWRGSDPTRGLYFTGPTAWAADRPHMAWTQCQDEDAHFLFPCHDHPGVKHGWRMTLDAPLGYTLLSNGRAVEEGQREGRAFAVYEQVEPMPAYLFSAVAARLHRVEACWKGTPVRYFVPVGEEEAVVRAFGKTPLMMEAFSRITGVDYPWPRYDQVVVHDFIFGGMENIACTTMTDALLVDEKGSVDWDPDGLVAHELAHQWFGDLVTCQDWSQGWLNESWATFMESVWWEEDRPTPDATWYRWTTAREYLHETTTRYRRPIVSYQFREPIDVFDRHLYQKGASVLWTLRGVLGDEGFWAGTRSYLETHAHGTVHTRHFQRALEQASGRNLDGFFHQWVHSPGHPQVDVKLAEQDGLLTVSLTQKQAGDDVPDAFHFDLGLQVVFDDDSTLEVRLPVRERDRTWAIPIAKTVATVRVDPGLGLLAELDVKGPSGWLERLLADPCPVVAVRAAKALLAKDSVRGPIAVRSALTTHPFHGVRATLAGDLGQRGTPADRDALLDALAIEDDPRVQRSIVVALGSFREAPVADALLAMLETEPATWQLHGALLLALGRIRDPRAVDAIRPHLGVASWSELVRQRALAALAATEEPDVLPDLVDHSRAIFNDRVRGAAAIAIGTLADKVEHVRNRAAERLLEMVDEPGFRAQLMAVDALGIVKDARAIPKLEQIRKTAPDGRLRRAAYEALVHIRRGRTSEQGLAGLRKQLEELAEENRKLRGRLDRLDRHDPK